MESSHKKAKRDRRLESNSGKGKLTVKNVSFAVPTITPLLLHHCSFGGTVGLNLTIAVVLPHPDIIMKHAEKIAPMDYRLGEADEN